MMHPTKLKTFDNFYSLQVKQRRPENYRQLEEAASCRYQIPRGSGLSYAASSFGPESTSILMSRINRILNFDSKSGIVEVEAGLALSDLYSFLFSRGFYLAIQPGHGKITVGGCVAADVHGKNQYRDGNFKNQVISILLFHPNNGWLELSRDSHSPIFNLTCGGFGLTGYIVRVKLQAKPLISSSIASQVLTFTASSDAKELLEMGAETFDFLHSWHNFSYLSKHIGKGLVFSSTFCADENFKADTNFVTNLETQKSKFSSKTPFSLWNPYSIKLANYLFMHRNSRIKEKSTSLDSVLYPAQKLEQYFSFFGSKGFHEYQVLIPENLFVTFLEELEKEVIKHRYPITLVSCKYFDGEKDLLRFIGKGISIAVNFPRDRNVFTLIDWLDQKTIELDGVPNISKDSRLPRDVVEATYHQIDSFRAQLMNFDSNRIFRSELSNRLAL